MPIYTYAQLQADVNSKIKGKLNILTDARSTLNQGVRQVLAEIDMVSMRRRKPLVPNLFTGLFEYDAPDDLKGYSIITVENQKWTRRPFWKLVPYEQFMRRQEPLTIAVSDYNGTRKVFIKNGGPTFGTDNINLVISNLDTLTSGGGTWEAFGTAENLFAGQDNFVEGVGSIRFDFPDNTFDAGIQNSTLVSFDASSYLEGNGSVIVWAYLVDKDPVLSFTFRMGSDSSNYYEKTITGNFANGWNNLNFDFATFNTVGSPVATALTYCAVFFSVSGSNHDLVVNGGFDGGTTGWTLQTL